MPEEQDAFIGEAKLLEEFKLSSDPLLKRNAFILFVDSFFPVQNCLIHPSLGVTFTNTTLQCGKWFGNNLSSDDDGTIGLQEILACLLMLQKVQYVCRKVNPTKSVLLQDRHIF